MNENKRENSGFPIEISAEALTGNPETVNQMLNNYGTYNVQATADSDYAFPAIAQGLSRKNRGRAKKNKFYDIIGEKDL